MRRELEIVLPPEEADSPPAWEHAARRQLPLQDNGRVALRLIKKSYDARRAPVVARLRLEAIWDEPYEPPPPPAADLERYPQLPDKAPRVVIVGSGPAGLFAALECLRHGVRPVILERGKDASARRFDLRPILVDGHVDEDSNYCFGEGGAGTFSDGKLYTRATKRGDVMDIYQTLVAHGAKPDILTDAHPHIGSNALPNLVKAIRNTILDRGGEVHFQTRVTGLLIDKSTGSRATRQLAGVVSADGREWTADAVILATGHSARDIFTLLDQNDVHLEAKPFAVGLRIEHPQPLIDRLQYHLRDGQTRPYALPAARYRLACKIDGRSVHSFCMCPGGFIVPASTDNHGLVINGMSLAKRDSPFANSGIVVGIEPSDLPTTETTNSAMAGVAFQRALEIKAKAAGGGGQRAPAQRATDFLAGRKPQQTLPSSYKPGLTPFPLHDLFPEAIAKRLASGLDKFGRSMRGYIGPEAQLIAIESRTSCPLRIPRDPESLENPDLAGLIPSGEGAGYAGGIVSAALDGIRAAHAAARIASRKMKADIKSEAGSQSGAISVRQTNARRAAGREY